MRPREQDPTPICPICGDETATYYRNSAGFIIGCESCVEMIDAWEYKEDHK